MRDKLLVFPILLPAWDALIDDLSIIEERALFRLIAYYARHGGVPADDRSLTRIADVDPRVWRRIRPKLAPKFPAEGWRWPEIDAQIAKREKMLVQKSLAGQQGNFKRWASLRDSHAGLPKRKLVPRGEH